MFKSLMSQIMTEAHAAAKADMEWSKANAHLIGVVQHPYSYFLGLQMRNAYAAARVKITGMAPCFEIREPRHIWA